jgi:hypothetical protein
MTSGLPMLQPSLHSIGAGASCGLPSSAPPRTQPTSVSTSVGVSVRSLANVPCAGSANHGGICFCWTAARIAFAHGRACS